MNYTKHYELLISRAKERELNEYVEMHHIIPKCLSGDDKKSNIVKLTPREHFTAHLLLVKMYPSNSKLIYAANMMGIGSLLNNRPMSPNRKYSWLRGRFVSTMSASQTGKGNSQYGKRWVVKNTIAIKINSNEVPEYLDSGWKLGRVEELKPRHIYKAKPRTCSRCGSIKCEYPEICKKTNMVKTLIKFFGFDDQCLGSIDFYKEFFKVRRLIELEYHTNMLSTLDIATKYEIPSTQRVDSIFKSLGIEKRNLSDAGKNFYNRSIV